MKILEQTPSFDDDDKEGDDNEEAMEKPKEALMNPAFATELVQFPQPRWSDSMATAE